MGFFRDLLGKAVSALGTLFNSESLARKGAEMRGQISTSIGTTKAYRLTVSDPNEVSTTQDIDQLNKVLANHVRAVQKQTSNLSSGACRIMDALVQELSSSHPSADLSSALARDLQREKNAVHNLTAKVVANRFTLTNPALLAIVRMRPGDLKTDRMSAFTEQVQSEALSYAEDETRRAINRLLSRAEDVLLYRLAQSEQELAATEESLMDIAEHRKTPEQARAQCRERIAQTQAILDMLQ